MKKKVNIKVQFPIYTVCPPILNDKKEITLPVGDIRRCIANYALVDEVLDDGKTIRLDFTNCEKDHGKKNKGDDQHQQKSDHVENHEHSSAEKEEKPHVEISHVSATEIPKGDASHSGQSKPNSVKPNEGATLTQK